MNLILQLHHASCKVQAHPSPNGDRVALIAEWRHSRVVGGPLQVYDVASGALLLDIRDTIAMHIRWAPSGTQLVACLCKHARPEKPDQTEWAIFSLSNGLMSLCMAWPSTTGVPFTGSALWSPDSSLLAIQQPGRESVCVREGASGALIWSTAQHPGRFPPHCRAQLAWVRSSSVSWGLLFDTHSCLVHLQRHIGYATPAWIPGLVNLDMRAAHQQAIGSAKHGLIALASKPAATGSFGLVLSPLQSLSAPGYMVLDHFSNQAQEQSTTAYVRRVIEHTRLSMGTSVWAPFLVGSNAVSAHIAHEPVCISGPGSAAHFGHRECIFDPRVGPGHHSGWLGKALCIVDGRNHAVGGSWTAGELCQLAGRAPVTCGLTSGPYWSADGKVLGVLTRDCMLFMVFA